jgi:hypothetical protein
LLYPKRFPRLHKALLDSPEWKRVHVEESCVVYVTKELAQNPNADDTSFKLR